MQQSSNSIDKLFFNLHQFQINLLKNTSKQTVNDYLNQLKLLVENEQQIDNNANQDINSFIHFLIFPVLTVLKKLQTNDSQREWLDLNEQLIECISTVLEKIKLSDSNIFYEVLNICSILLSKKMNETTTNNNDNNNNTDEFYLACLKLVKILFQNSSTNLIESFYQFKNLTSIGLLVSVFLDIVHTSNSIEVRLNCLDSLKIIISTSNNNNNSGKIGIIFASFLPGISIKLIQRFLLAQNLKLLNHKLICKSLECLSAVICHVFDDSFLDGVYFIRYFDQLMNQNENKLSDNLKNLIVNRIENKDWLSDSTQKLFMLIRHLLDELIISENLNVHLSMVQFCAQISMKCYFSFNDQLAVLLKVLALFAATTSDLKVNKLATEALSQMGGKAEAKLGKHATGQYLLQNKFSIMQTCIEELLLKLPRLMNQDSNNNLDESYRLSHLRQLYGYLKLIGSDNYYAKDADSIDLKEFLHLNMENLNKLLLALISCISFDYKSLDNFYQLSNQSELKDNNPSSMSNYIGLETYLSDKNLFEQLSQICNYLGRSNAARLLIDELLTNAYLQQKQNKCELMFLINLILQGVSENKRIDSTSNDINSIIRMVLANFINESQIDIQIESIQTEETNNYQSLSSSSSITVDRNRKILQKCLVIEAISISSKCLDRKDFDLFLIDTLYYCLENYLNNNLLIRVVARKCLESLTSNLNYTSIQELLSINYDYIMNDLVLKSHKQIRLKFKENNDDESILEPHVYVLCSLLDIANIDIVPYLERLVDDYFLSIELNSMDHTIIIGICSIMLHMSRSMRKWYPVELNFIENNNPGENFLSNLNLKSLVKSKQKLDVHRSFKDTLIEIEESINEFKMQKEMTSNETSNKSIDQLVQENEDEMEKIGNEQIEREQAEKEEKQVSLHVRLQCKCMQLCMHLISHPFKQIRLSIIDLIGELSRNLAGHINEFLPLVHKLWMPICQRFSFDDFIVKSKIIYLLFDLSVYCNDFLASRFCKEFLPRLCKFMQDQSQISLKSSKDTTYIYSHAFKLQSAILSNLDKMCILYDIKEMELEQVLATSIFSYLDKRQPKKLQLLALNSIQNCSLIDPDLVWLCLHYILPFTNLDSNLVHSKNIKLKSDYQFSNEILEGLIQVFRNFQQAE